MKAVASPSHGSSELHFTNAPAQRAPLERVKVSRFGTTVSFLTKGACSHTLMHVLNREFDHPQPLEERATDPLAGGLMRGYQCGMLWGSTLSAGAQAHRLFGAGPRAEAASVRAAQRLVSSFRARNHHIDCLEITETDPQNGWQTFVHFMIKGGMATCIRRANDYATDALNEINGAFAEVHQAHSCNPATCASRLAQLVGVSDMHSVMASGLAGGIGLSGGACGALGAAIWIIGMKGREAGLKTREIDSIISETMESFSKAADHEFECSEIVGRQFEDLDDHAEHVHSGGCSDILELLASEIRSVSSDRN